MPLPSGGGTWPPQALQPIYDQYAVHNAWYVGNSDELAQVYGDHTGGARPANRPSQYRGGIVGKAARMFWGAPVPQGERRTKLHVPVASDIATMSSDLLFSEPPSITVENKQTQERIEELVENGLQATLLEGAEVGAALGGYYLRAVWDKAVAEQPWLAVVHADAAVPEFRWGRLSAVTFWRIVEQPDDKTYLRHLERHEPGRILHALYRGEHGSLGKPIPLDSVEATRGLQPVVETRIKKLTAVYVPNMRPNREWRRDPNGANLGRSDFAGPVLGLFDALDETYTSWMRDVRHGKGRIHVPSSYIQNQGRGQGGYYDPDREVYEALDVLGGDQRMELSVTQFQIRVAEHRDTAAELLAAILRATGYSAQSFGLTGDVAITATEVMAKERRSLVTRGRKAVYTGPALADAVEMLLLLEAELFSSGVTPERPTVVFGDSVSADIQQLATTAELMRRAEAASTYELVRMLHPDWDVPEIEEEVQRIKDDQPTPVMDPFALPGEMTEPGPDGESPGSQAEQDGPPEE
ncbi:phage portal protein [Streptosporangium sp. NBC_01755]|uniref:phage portal protein n=1 Tax=Streptosporangium sp. NBC_01755 TaxID=2975949 RepID=UPI002DD9730B|nr:phage portal protein [Streptosporangium sp. NBC_01755]WSC98413.1 phage portal protein [Streptosporangium sp. NBC_01755]